MFEFVVALVALGILAAAMWFAFKLVYPMLRKHSSDEPESARTQLIIPPDPQGPQSQTQHYPRRTRVRSRLTGSKDRVAGHFSRQRSRYGKLGTVLALFAVAVLATAALVTTGETEKVSDDDSSEEEPIEEEETATAISDECQTWQLAESDNNQNRWFANGVPAIAEASTEDEAHQAVNEWLKKVRQDPDLLAGASLYLLDQKVEQDALFNDEGCATEVAVDLVNELEAVQSMSAVSAEEAPSDGVNSGVDENGQVTQANHVGVTGDRDAVKIVTPHGETIWVMARCGNPVAKKPPEEVPEGPTDQPEPEPTPTPVPTPTPTPTSEPKCEGDGVCGTPDSGAEQQPVADNDPGHTGPTDGYDDPNREDTSEPGPAEDNSREQEEARQDIESGEKDEYDQTESGVEVPDSDDGGEAPGGGDESADAPSEQEDKDQQDGAGGDNPQNDGEEPSSGTDEGTSNDADSEEAQTDNSDDTEESGDPADDDNEDTNMSLPSSDGSDSTASTESSESDDGQESSDSSSSDSSDTDDSESQDSSTDDSGGAAGQPVQG